MKPFLWCSLVWVLCVSALQAQADLPEPLRQALEARRRIRTAAVELMQTRPDGAPVFYTVQLAPQDAAWFNWGDPAGVVGDDPQREGRPHSVLRQKDALWSYDHDRTFAEYYASPEVRAENVPDLRSLGLMFFTSYEDPDTTIRRIERAGIDAFEVGRQGGLQVVTAHTQQGDVTWWLDPARDHQPVRVTLQRDGRLRREARIELGQIDGVWFPVHVETIGYTPDGREQSHDVSEVFYAEFNRPDHPDHLTPGDIGIEAGTLVTRYPSRKGSEALVWDGRQLVPFSQYRGTFPHQRDADAAVVAPRAGLGFDARIRRKLSAWEAYTRAFIARHKLDRIRAGRAWRWLRECQRLAHRRIDAARRDLKRLEQRSSGSAGSQYLRGQRVARLMKALDDIFEQRLKPGLQRLLTPAERRAEQKKQPKPSGSRSTGP